LPKTLPMVEDGPIGIDQVAALNSAGLARPSQIAAKMHTARSNRKA